MFRHTFTHFLDPLSGILFNFFNLIPTSIELSDDRSAFEGIFFCFMRVEFLARGCWLWRPMKNAGKWKAFVLVIIHEAETVNYVNRSLNSVRWMKDVWEVINPEIDKWVTKRIW